MLQDLYPHIYHNEMAWKAPAPDDYALIFAPDGTVYCDLTDGALTLPRIRMWGRERHSTRFPSMRPPITSWPPTRTRRTPSATSPPRPSGP